jgi:hypothetical protein
MNWRLFTLLAAVWLAVAAGTAVALVGVLLMGCG